MRNRAIQRLDHFEIVLKIVTVGLTMAVAAVSRFARKS